MECSLGPTPGAREMQRSDIPPSVTRGKDQGKIGNGGCFSRCGRVERESIVAECASSEI